MPYWSKISEGQAGVVLVKTAFGPTPRQYSRIAAYYYSLSLSLSPSLPSPPQYSRIAAYYESKNMLDQVRMGR